MTLKVLIIGEGPTDVGIVDVYGIWKPGCIVTLLKKVNPSVPLDFIPPPNKRDITAVPTVKKKGEPKFEGHAKIIQKQSCNEVI